MRHVGKMRFLLGSIVGLTATLAVLSWPAPSTATQTQSVFQFGAAGYFGSAGVQPLNQLIVGIAATRSDHGYWTVASDGGIFTYGDAQFYGSSGSIHLNQPVVGMAAAPDGRGYWLVAADGGIFTYGDAQFYGSSGSIHLNQPVVGMAATPDGRGYWLVAADGGIFTYGDAQFYGSSGSIHLNQPVVGMAAAPDGRGYWLVAADGGIFTYGDAQFYGSSGSIHLNQPVVGMAAAPDGRGYWLVAADGGIFTFGSAVYFGSLGGSGLTQPVVGMTATQGGNGYWIASSGVLHGPANITPLVAPGLPGEGQWAPSPLIVGGPTVLYTTYLRPYLGASPTYLAWMRGRELRFALYAGTDQPAGSWPNEWIVPGPLQSQLVATFNSGFRLAESRGGWYANGVAATPLVNGAASFVIYQDGSATVGQWGRDVNLTANVVAIRQNLSLLINNGQISPTVGDIQASWGLTLGGVSKTWRSGLCVDHLGNLIYAAGPGLDPTDLARLMQAAGCMQAMELDINPMWPIFVNYPPSGPAELAPGMYFPPDKHTATINERDFIAAFAR